MRGVFIAVLVAMMLAYVGFHVLSEVFHVSVHLASDIVSPLIALVAVVAVAGIVAALGFMIAISVMGALFAAGAAVFVAIAFIGIGLAWPAVLVFVILYLLVRDNRRSSLG